MCHLLLLMPILGIPVFWLWPVSIAAPVYAVILVVSAWLYFFVMRAMRRPVGTGSEGIMQSIGEVIDDTKTKMTCVRVQSELWGAVSSEPLHRGDRVRVVAIDGLTLRVQRLPE